MSLAPDYEAYLFEQWTHGVFDDYWKQPGIYAIGDCAGNQLLAHKASHEGIVCVERIAGEAHHPVDYGNVPNCTYCHPEVASVGLTESQAKDEGYDVVTALTAFLLLIAGINVTNLATARSLDRTREIGVRKTLGAHRGQLARQFLVESVLVSALATVLGAVLASAAVPVFEQVVGVEFVLEAPWDAQTLGALAVLAVVVGLASGAYPAAVLSGFAPMAVLRDRLSLGWSAGAIRKGLVVVQFALAIVLMAGVYVLNEQVNLATSPDAPYPADRMLVKREVFGPHPDGYQSETSRRRGFAAYRPRAIALPDGRRWKTPVRRSTFRRLGPAQAGRNSAGPNGHRHGGLRPVGIASTPASTKPMP